MIAVQLVKFQGMSGEFGIKKEDRYRVVLFNKETNAQRTVDNNDGWGWRRDRGISGAQTWADFFNTKYVEYEEQTTIQTKIVLKEQS